MKPRSKSGKWSDPEYVSRYNREWLEAHPELRKARNEARKSQHKLEKYGLTQEEYDRIVSGPCHICGSTDGGGRWGKMCLDHDHNTGQLRGALCAKCNKAIGLLRDDPEIIRQAAIYLYSHKQSYPA